MQERWTLVWTMLLLIGHISTDLCQAQEPTTDDDANETTTEAKDSVLSHIHFSDNSEEDVSKANEGSGGDDECLSQSVSQGQCTKKNYLDVVLGICTSLDESDRETQEAEPTPVKLEYQRPVCKKGEGCDIPLNCYDFVTNGPHDIVPDPPRAVELTPLEMQNLLANGTYKNCCALVMFYAPWCEYSINFAHKFNAIGRTFLNLPVISVDLSSNDP